jgi:hypothetical protein
VPACLDSLLIGLYVLADEFSWANSTHSPARPRVGRRGIARWRENERAGQRQGQVRSEHTEFVACSPHLLGELWLGGDFHACLLDLLVRGCFKVL